MAGSFVSILKDLPQTLKPLREGLRISKFQTLETMDGHVFGFVLDENILEDELVYQVSIFADDPSKTVSTKGKTFARFVEGHTGAAAENEIKFSLGYTNTVFETLCKHATDTLEDVSKLLELLSTSEICSCELDMIEEDCFCCNNCMIGMAETDHKLMIPTLRGTKCVLRDMLKTTDESMVMSDYMRLRTKNDHRFEVGVLYKNPGYRCVIRSKDVRVSKASKHFKETSTGGFMMMFKEMDEDLKDGDGIDVVPKIRDYLVRIVGL